MKELLSFSHVLLWCWGEAGEKLFSLMVSLILWIDYFFVVSHKQSYVNGGGSCSVDNHTDLDYGFQAHMYEWMPQKILWTWYESHRNCSHRISGLLQDSATFSSWPNQTPYALFLQHLNPLPHTVLVPVNLYLDLMHSLLS